MGEIVDKINFFLYIYKDKTKEVKKMKKIFISMAMVAMMVAMVSCGGRKPKAEVAVNDSTVVVVADSVAADSVRVDSTVVSQ